MNTNNNETLNKVVFDVITTNLFRKIKSTFQKEAYFVDKSSEIQLLLLAYVMFLKKIDFNSLKRIYSTKDYIISEILKIYFENRENINKGKIDNLTATEVYFYNFDLNEIKKKFEDFINYLFITLDKPELYYQIYINLYMQPMIGSDYKSVICHEKIVALKYIAIKNNRLDEGKFMILLNELKTITDNEFNKSMEDFFLSQYFRLSHINLKKEEHPTKNCYIATLAYGDINHPKVEFLRYYRDNKLNKTIIGKFFVKTYYATSPYIVRYLKDKNKINKTIKNILDYIITKINK